MKIPYTKAHGALNDFLMTWTDDAPGEALLPRAAIAICHRNSGVGADGWLLVEPPIGDRPAAIRLFNSDGSTAEMSGNGTRCAAAFLTDTGHSGESMEIVTGAGTKLLRQVRREGLRFLFEMEMGQAQIAADQLHFGLPLKGGVRECTLLWVGNPQCAFFVDEFAFDWKAVGAEVERHVQFPNRTNVSFVKVVDRRTLDVRFFERGAGFTMSSGTGSTGAFAAAQARGLVDDRCTVGTLAGPLEFRLEDSIIHMQGPAEIVADGDYYFNP